MEINENGIIVERFSDEKLTDQELARREKLKKLEDLGTKIYRTDEDGTIILTSDGENMSFETVKTDTNGG